MTMLCLSLGNDMLYLTFQYEPEHEVYRCPREDGHIFALGCEYSGLITGTQGITLGKRSLLGWEVDKQLTIDIGPHQNTPHITTVKDQHCLQIFHTFHNLTSIANC